MILHFSFFVFFLGGDWVDDDFALIMTDGRHF